MRVATILERISDQINGLNSLYIMETFVVILRLNIQTQRGIAIRGPTSAMLREEMASLFLFLKPRRLALATLIASGKSDKEIARLLAISPSAVKQQISAMLHEADLHNRAELAAIYAHLIDKLGLEEPADPRE